MIQFNLLPDIKLKFIKTQRTKHVVTFISVIVGLASLGLLAAILFFVYVVQAQIIKSYDNKINTTQSQIMQVKDVEKMLTVQNQLNTLTTLHMKKPVATRLFGYIQQTTPQTISLNKLDVDFVESTISFGGTGPNLEAVKVYTDVLKNSRYIIVGNENKDHPRAFSEVVSTISRNEKDATFSISAKFDPVLFLKDKDVQIQVSIPSTVDASLQQNPFQGDQ